jgi:hypothetical protein
MRLAPEDGRSPLERESIAKAAFRCLLRFSGCFIPLEREIARKPALNGLVHRCSRKLGERPAGMLGYEGVVRGREAIQQPDDARICWLVLRDAGIPESHACVSHQASPLRSLDFARLTALPRKIALNSCCESEAICSNSGAKSENRNSVLDPSRPLLALCVSRCMF